MFHRFGHVVKVYYKDVFAKHAALFEELKVNPNNGLGDVYDKIQGHAKQSEVEADLMATYETRPKLAMVDSRKGITNLHVPSDVIIDASMPNVIRDSGGMWNTDDALEDTKCLIPDRCYATFYQAVMEDCRANGQFDPSTMGNVANVGLMAQKAEEYGSHPYTFEGESVMVGCVFFSFLCFVCLPSNSPVCCLSLFFTYSGQCGYDACRGCHFGRYNDGTSSWSR